MFVPNLNVTRIKKENTAENHSPSHKNHDNKKRGGKKEKFEKKERPQLIQTTGSVFSEGIGAGGAGARQRSGFSVKYESDGGGGASNKSLVISYDKDEEERRLKALMRDDFIDDLKSGDCIPVQLPMIDTGFKITLSEDF